MAANWPAFQAQLNPWFCGDAEGGDKTTDGSKTAKKIADAYEMAIMSAGVIPWNNLYSSGFVKATMEAGFKASFAQQMSAAGSPPEGIDLGVPVWIAAAQGTINAWAAVQYVPLPPHLPTVLPIVGVLQLDPGAGGLMPLAQSIYDAFHCQQCSLVANILMQGFIQHMTMISGVYIGMGPNPAPPPPLIPYPPIPWFGVS